MKLTSPVVLALLFLFPLSITDAAVVNVPDDVETIQGAIDRADDGDTVLVQPETYVENIDFLGKSITVASRFLIRGEEEFIRSTIIDGDDDGSVVTFNNGEDTTSALIGFTLTNGNGTGGGINICYASPVISDCIIEGNRSPELGGGVYCYYALPRIYNTTINDNTAYNGGGICLFVSGAILRNVNILNNEAEFAGGGIYDSNAGEGLIFEGGEITGNEATGYGGGIYMICGSTAEIRDVKITENYGSTGGGIYISGMSGITMNYVLVAQNSARNSGGMHLVGSNAKELTNVTVCNNTANSIDGIFSSEQSRNSFANCIIWHHEDWNLFLDGGSQTSISYSDVQDGEEGVDIESNAQLQWSDGNIEDDPEFLDCSYELPFDSPCVDSGDPESPPDLDRSRADMGAFPTHKYIYLYGTILDAADGHVLSNAVVSTSNGEIATVDTAGHWATYSSCLDLDLTASCYGYNDSTLTDLHFEFFDSVEYNFNLLHPEILISNDDLMLKIGTGETAQVDINVSNAGNGHLELSTSIEGKGGEFSEPWELRRSIPAGEVVNDTRLMGVVYADDRFYLSGGGGETNYIYVLDREGEYLDRFAQPGEAAYGLRDLAWDGELIWGSGDGRVYGFSTDGRVHREWEGPWDPNACLAWDGDRELLWISSITSDIIGCDRNGSPQRQLPRHDLRIYGLAWWQDDPESYNLYIFHRERETGRHMIHRMNPETGDTLFVSCLSEDDAGSPQGIFISDRFDALGGATLMSMQNFPPGAGGDRLSVWQVMKPVLYWAQVDPRETTLLPRSALDLTVTLSTVDPDGKYDLDLGLYQAELMLDNNSGDGLITLPIALSVMPPNDYYDDSALQPHEFGISSVFPNPFNSSATLKYRIKDAGNVLVTLFDVSGRDVGVLWEGYSEPGSFSLQIDAAGLPGGLYFVRLEEDHRSSQAKLLCVK